MTGPGWLGWLGRSASISWMLSSKEILRPDFCCLPWSPPLLACFMLLLLPGVGSVP